MERRRFSRRLSFSKISSFLSTLLSHVFFLFFQFWSEVQSFIFHSFIHSHFSIFQSIGKYIGPEVQSFISSLLTFYVAFSTGWKMTLVALAGYPIIAMSHQIQQKQTDDSVKPKEMDVSQIEPRFFFLS